MKPVAVVDGANVAYNEISAHGEPKVSNLVEVRRALEQKGFEPLIIVDASLRHEVDDPRQLEALIDDKIIRQAPSDTDADYFILKIAEEMDGLVISNDEYEAYRDQYAWIEKQRVPFMIIKGHVELYEKKMNEKKK